MAKTTIFFACNTRAIADKVAQDYVTDKAFHQLVRGGNAVIGSGTWAGEHGVFVELPSLDEGRNYYYDLHDIQTRVNGANRAAK